MTAMLDDTRPLGPGGDFSNIYLHDSENVTNNTSERVRKQNVNGPEAEAYDDSSATNGNNLEHDNYYDDKNGAISDVSSDQHTNGHAYDSDSSSRTEPRIAESASLRRQHDLVERLICECQTRGSPVLDLSRKGLRTLPASLLALSHLEYLYLEGNELVSLPDDLFDCFPRLKWLDLRHNLLSNIPSIYLSSHECLKTLLLEGNRLTTLPLELGLISTLDGLNLRDNPLEFPPQQIVERGVRTISAFLRLLLKNKSEGNMTMPDVDELLSLADGAQSSSHSFSQSFSAKSKSSGASSQKSRSLQSQGQSSGHPGSVTGNDTSSGLGPVSQSAGLHRPTSYGEIKSQKQERLKKSGLLGVAGGSVNGKVLVTQSDKYIDVNAEPPPYSRAEKKAEEELKKSKQQRVKIKQDEILQERKNQEMRKKFREETKQLQQRKDRQKRILGRIDYKEPASLAPYGVEHEHMKVMTNEQRIALDIMKKHEKLRRAMSPDAADRLEGMRRQRERELEARIQQHTILMHERRQKQSENPREDVDAARKNLEIAEELHREVELRRKELEYRFTAHAVNAIDVNTKHKKTYQSTQKY